MIGDCFGPFRLIQYWFLPEKLPLECWAALNLEMSLADLALPRYLLLFSLTILLEFIVYWFLLRRRRSLLQIIGINLALNFATHPIVTFLFPLLAAWQQRTTGSYVIAAEIYAPLVEALMLRFIFGVRAGRAIAASVIANLVSWVMGLWILSVLEAY